MFEESALHMKICDLIAPITKAQQVEFFERKLIEPLCVSEIALDDGVHYVCLADTYRDACIGRARLVFEMDEDTLSDMHYMADLAMHAA